MKNESFSLMRGEMSMKGLSEIMEESYKDELETSKYELAKLSNEQFLSQYLQLNNNRNIINQYRSFLETPSCEVYKKFDFSEFQKKEIFRKQIKSTIQNGLKQTVTFYSKETLKALANKKIVQAVEKQKLSNSRKEKKDQFYEQLRTSRKLQESRELKIETSRVSAGIPKLESPTKHAVTQQSIDDLFLRLEVIGESRDKIKKRWYGWGEKGKSEQKRVIIQEWSANHQLMKNLLQTLLQNLNRTIGTVQVFNQLKLSNQNLLKSLSPKAIAKSQYEKSLGSTRIDKNLKGQEVKQIYHFGSWFNKLLLDQRQLEYIENLKK